MSETAKDTSDSPSTVKIETLLKNMETRLLRLQAQMHGATAATSSSTSKISHLSKNPSFVSNLMDLSFLSISS